MWVAALRSGNYKQGLGALHKGDEFCCLGVLCELAAHAGVVLDVQLWESGRTTYDRNWHGLPPSVQKWSGTRSMDGEYDSEEHTLSTLNDSEKSFEHIADVIEENWERL